MGASPPPIGHADFHLAGAAGPDPLAVPDVAYLAFHDPLTGLPNRARVRDHLEAALLECERNGHAVALLYVDLDDFKLVNDSLGHAAGDELLREVAARLGAVARDGDLLSRQGGDEFLMLLSGLERDSAAATATAVAEEVGNAFGRSFSIGEAVFEIGASVGISVYPADAAGANELHMHADAAMYQAKEAGAGHAFYEPSDTDPLARLSLAARMRRALAADEFELHYQPIYELAGGSDPKIRGVEALIRWRDPQRGLVPPDQFIPVAERTGVIDAIGDWVIGAVARQAREWQDEGLLPNFGVNVSPRQLRRPRFHEGFVAKLVALDLDPSRFVVELTESTWMLEAHRATPVLEALSDAGVRLALDDFGAGYSSLGRLRRLSVAVIKIDRSFMNGLPDDDQACAIVAAILQLADTVGCDVVAEGVETAEQLAFLSLHGCRLAQGFHLARPMPAEHVTPLLRDGLLTRRRI
jgi:diguanylate cyclase (GGDEF)-like protein